MIICKRTGWLQLCLACMPSGFAYLWGTKTSSQTHLRNIRENNCFLRLVRFLNSLPRLLKEKKMRKQVKKILNLRSMRVMWKLEVQSYRLVGESQVHRGKKTDLPFWSSGFILEADTFYNLFIVLWIHSLFLTVPVLFFFFFETFRFSSYVFCQLQLMTDCCISLYCFSLSFLSLSLPLFLSHSLTLS